MKTNKLFTTQKYFLACFLAVILFMVSPSVKAQENNRNNNDRPGVAFGIKGGINYSTIAVDMDAVNKQNGKIGLQGGFFVKIPLAGQVLSLQPEVLYSSLGSKISYDPLKNTNFKTGEEVRFNLNYANVPVLLVVNIGPVNLQGGVYASYLLSANVKNLEYTDAVNPTTIATFDRNDFNAVDYGLVGGIGANSNKFHFGIRYNYGLREIGNSGVIKTVTDGSRNTALQAYIGVAF